MPRLLSVLAIVHASYYVLTGVWPLVHMKSFLAVTGPKTDVWLVNTVAVLVIAIGLPIGVAGVRGTIGGETLLLAIGAAIGLAAIDVTYVAKRVIAPIYLSDALMETVLVAGWLLLWFTR
jgi:hypothetical protein